MDNLFKTMKLSPESNHFCYMFHAILILWLATSAALAAAASSLSRPNCQDLCGKVSIPYPFGIGAGCYMNNNFDVNCNLAFNPPKPFLTRIGLELLNVSLTGYAQVNSPVISSNCGKTDSAPDVNLSGTPFYFSNEHNRFTAMGCNNMATFDRGSGEPIGGCLSICNGTMQGKGCYGIQCCQTTIPDLMDSFKATMSQVENLNISGGNCNSAFMVDQSWLDSLNRLDGVPTMEYVPAVLRWASQREACDVINGKSPSTFCSSNGFCWSQLGQDQFCVCSPPNPLLRHSNINYTIGHCTGTVKDCIYNTASCSRICTAGSKCPCPDGYGSQNNGTTCTKRGPIIDPSPPPSIAIFIGCLSGLGFLLLLFGSWWLYKVMKRRNAAKLRQQYFKKNGGLLLEQQMSGGEINVEQMKLFDSKELAKATDQYHENRILGQGGQGTVYKGMLTDGRIVAIKKSKVEDEGRLEFINEVVILTQINHRNVVKLLGCCLETEVPMLVYEFVPNGTLFQHLHDPNEEFPITWEMRLRIASEVAAAVSYLHSAASIPIYHRDIKSTNILLNEKYRAKVSDFGTSRSISIDQTHLTTRVLGTFGYLDPEYFQSSQFTEKSDVYSFGVVLVELLTGQKAISATRTVEGRSLATYFLDAMEQEGLFNILDARVLKEGAKEEITMVANLAKRCLNLNGKKRPTMKVVAMELEGIRSSQGAYSTIYEESEEVEYGIVDMEGSWDSTSASGSMLNSNVSIHVPDEHPLLFHTR